MSCPLCNNGPEISGEDYDGCQDNRVDGYAREYPMPVDDHYDELVMEFLSRNDDAFNRFCEQKYVEHEMYADDQAYDMMRDKEVQE